MQGFKDILNTIRGYFSKKNQPIMDPMHKDPKVVDQAFIDKGLIKLTDPQTGEVTWSSPESAKKTYLEGWSDSSVPREEESNWDWANLPQGQGYMPAKKNPVATITPTPDKAGQPYAGLINQATSDYELP